MSVDLMQAERVRLSTKAEFSHTYDVVASVLEESERARNDDQFLILCVLKKQGSDIRVEFNLEKKRTEINWLDIDVADLSSFETITRCRRKIQNGEGRFLPTENDVIIKRRIREEAVREYYAGGGR